MTDKGDAEVVSLIKQLRSLLELDGSTPVFISAEERWGVRVHLGVLDGTLQGLSRPPGERSESLEKDLSAAKRFVGPIVERVLMED